MKTQLPKRVRLMRYHWRHYSVLNALEKGLPKIYEALVSVGWHHAPGNTPSPEDQCIKWLKAHNYKLVVGEYWELTTPENVS